MNLHDPALEIKKSMVQIITSEKGSSSFGTGFFVKENCILTANHVVEDLIQQPFSLLFSYEALKEIPNPEKIIIKDYSIVSDEDMDFAIINIHAPIERNISCVPIYSFQSINNKNVKPYGYLKKNESLVESSAKCELTPTTYKKIECYALHLDGTEVTYAGFSGGPLTIENQVIGFIHHEYNNGDYAQKLYGSFFKEKHVELLRNNGVGVIKGRCASTLSGDKMITNQLKNKLENLQKIRAEWDEKKEFMLKNEPSISDLERMYSLKKSLEHIEENIRKNNLEINKVLLELKEGEE